MSKTPLEKVPSIGPRDRISRAIWSVAWLVLCRPTPIPLHGWRTAILRLFGASIARRCYVYPTTQVWAPWNLEMETGSCLGPGVTCYNVAQVSLGKRALVSQGTYLCSASHDFDSPAFPLVIAPIRIDDDAWVATDAFVAPGVAVDAGGVVLARSVVTRNVPEWTVVAGNPAKPLRKRLRHDDASAASRHKPTARN